MATNLAIDPDLLQRALAVGGEKTKKATVTKALAEFIARREQQRLLDLFGALEWDPTYDYKQERSHKYRAIGREARRSPRRTSRAGYPS